MVGTHNFFQNEMPTKIQSAGLFHSLKLCVAELVRFWSAPTLCSGSGSSFIVSILFNIFDYSFYAICTPLQVCGAGLPRILRVNP